MIKLLEDYNVLKVFSLEEVTKYSASVKAELWIAAVLSLGYILLCTAFLICPSSISSLSSQAKNASGQH